MGKGLEKEYLRHTGFIKSRKMNRFSLAVFVFSHCHDPLEKLCSIYNLDSEIIQNDNVFKVCILSVNTTSDDTDDVVRQGIDALSSLYNHLKEQGVTEFSIKVDIEVIVTDGDETPIPGIVLPADFISLASYLDAQTRFHLLIKSSTQKGMINSGSYLYIMSDDEIDEPILNRVAGTQPSIIYRKGHMGRYTVVDFNSWGIEIYLEKQLPDNAALALMNRLQDPKKIGLYCKDNNYTSHVDLTCYSIPYESIHFNLETSFFTFLRDLSVQYLELDFMT